jgi:hypothetical protein
LHHILLAAFFFASLMPSPHSGSPTMSVHFGLEYPSVLSVVWWVR